MTLSSTVSEDGRTLRIEVGERFDFNLHTMFRTAQESAPRATEYIVDLARTEYMDSSALGMLLLLRDWATKRGGQVTLQRPQALVRKILSIANFERIFSIR